MTYVQIAATTNHTALTVSPRTKAMIVHATAPNSSDQAEDDLVLVLMGERSMMATGGRSASVWT